MSSLPERRFTEQERDQWHAVLFDIYDRMRARGRRPYEIKFQGLELTVLPEVYSPVFFTDTAWFARQLKDIVGHRSLLEMGTGSGAIACVCAKNGAQVVALDINPEAVKNAQLNAKRLGLNISVRQGDLYEPLRSDEKFDFIFWLHPFNNWEEPVDDMLLRSGMDYHYDGLRGYIAGSKGHLAPNGRLLLGTGNTADLRTIAQVAEKNGYELKILKEVTMPLEEGNVATIQYLLYEFILEVDLS